MQSLAKTRNLQILNLVMQKLKSHADHFNYSIQRALEAENETVVTDESVSNDLVYVDEEKITLKIDLCSRMLLKDPTLSVESIRFFTTRLEDRISVYAGVNICVRPDLPLSLELDESLKFEFPDEERRTFDRQYGAIRWHQDAFFDVATIEEVADKLIETFIEVSRQW